MEEYINILAAIYRKMGVYRRDSIDPMPPKADIS